jgi:hypothetical protein
MKKFNQTVSVEVEVDAIANQLLSQMKDSAKSEIVVQAIIGRMLSQDVKALGHLHTALMGYKRDISHMVGTRYFIKNLEVWGYWTPESIEKNDTVRGSINTAKVIAVDEYADDPVCIEFEIPQKDGTWKTETRWISTSRIGEIVLFQDNMH